MKMNWVQEKFGCFYSVDNMLEREQIAFIDGSKEGNYDHVSNLRQA
ncbi:MAG: hypothetical protein ACTSQK_12685 [Candidatus Heimdallarchaeota archaeon]